jgi:hypothetical protein
VDKRMGRIRGGGGEARPRPLPFPHWQDTEPCCTYCQRRSLQRHLQGDKRVTELAEEHSHSLSA